MDIDLLRRAADKLRTYANRVPPVAGEEPWYRTAPPPQYGFWRLLTEDQPDEASFIALMSPAVALALADWLDLQAQAEDGRVEQRKAMRCQPGVLMTHRDEQAYVVARAVLREDGA